jgi:hypothetical protein
MKSVDQIILEEGNEYEWTNEKTGYFCRISRIITGKDEYKRTYWCGYVYLPLDHPFVNKSYMDSICGHNGCMDHSLTNIIGELSYSAGNVFGFDGNHSLVHYYDKKFMIDETNKMAEKFWEYRNYKN